MLRQREMDARVGGPRGVGAPEGKQGSRMIDKPGTSSGKGGRSGESRVRRKGRGSSQAGEGPEPHRGEKGKKSPSQGQWWGGERRKRDRGNWGARTGVGWGGGHWGGLCRREKGV